MRTAFVIVLALTASTSLLTVRTAVTPLNPISAGSEAPTAPIAWWPKTGTVILSGGAMAADTAKTFEDRLIEVAGGPEAQIVVIPTAWNSLPAQLPTPDPQPSQVESVRRQFESRGAYHISFLHTLDHQVANSEEFAKVLRSAKAVFLPGGTPLRFEEAYGGTLVERELKALLDRGGVVAGDSAGAQAMGAFSLGWTPDPFGKLGQGLSLLPNATVACHANAARGFVMADEVLNYLSVHPTTVGITMDQDTVMILKGSAAEVFGRGSVVILDPAHGKTKRSFRMVAGDRHDFAK